MTAKPFNFADVYLSSTAAERFAAATPTPAFKLAERPGRVATKAQREEIEHALAAGVAHRDLPISLRELTEPTAKAPITPAADQGQDDGADPFQALRDRAMAAAFGNLPPVDNESDEADPE
jgi:hypothetical protein